MARGSADHPRTVSAENRLLAWCWMHEWPTSRTKVGEASEVERRARHLWNSADLLGRPGPPMLGSPPIGQGQANFAHRPFSILHQRQNLSFGTCPSSLIYHRPPWSQAHPSRRRSTTHLSLRTSARTMPCCRTVQRLVCQPCRPFVPPLSSLDLLRPGNKKEIGWVPRKPSWQGYTQFNLRAMNKQVEVIVASLKNVVRNGCH
jgi:hypothetical protein